MYYKFTSILGWSVLFMSVSCIMSHVYLETKLGFLKGTTMLSRNGRKFKAFMGVPYAQPPVGMLRFRVSSGLLLDWVQVLLVKNMFLWIKLSNNRCH